MRFATPVGSVFEIEDDWWQAAEMPAFVPSQSAYASDASKCTHPVELLSLDDIAPPARSPGVPTLDFDRAFKILVGFRLNQPIPPIHVAIRPPGLTHRYLLRDGFHRYHLAIACGFSRIPAEVDRWWEPWMEEPYRATAAR